MSLIKTDMTRGEFLNSFGTLANSFETSLQQAENLNNEFESILEKFSLNMNKLIMDAQEHLIKNDSSPLNYELNRFFETIYKTNDAWEKALSNKEKGIAFREKFSDSLLVFVYGKVKSGKSSLGNYIAWGITDNCQNIQLKSELQPQYFSHDYREVDGGDKKGEAETNRSFRVGATEATSSIQGFKLPGLTWVDSPGLHSYNDENGKLAKDYVDHADLIIYTMSSGAPGRKSDLQEIDQLFDQDKKLVVLITGSDWADEDYDDVTEQLISVTEMKSSEDRKKQREYVQKQLIGFEKHSSPEILSVSSRYAELHPNDHLAMKDSGFSALFEILVKISQEEGVQIKRKTPLNNFKHFINLCIQDLRPYQNLITNFRESILKTDNELQKLAILHSQEAKRELENIIRSDFKNLEMHGDNEEQIHLAMDSIRKNWEKSVNELAVTMIEAVFSDIMKEFQSNIRLSFDSSSIDIPDFNLNKVTETISDSYTKGSKARNSGIGGLLGAAAGAFFGPVGIAIGSTAGAYLGSMTGSKGQVNTRDIEIVIGNNLLEIESQAIAMYGTKLTDFMTQESEKIRQTFIGQAETVLENIEKELSIIKISLDQIKIKVTQLINN